MLVTVIFLFFGAYWFQMKYGLYGMALTQLGLLLIALAGCVISRRKLCEVFPFRRFVRKEARGSLYIYFGVFHLDPYRLLPTMILGMGFAYMMLKTGNMLYPIIFHALNNLFPLLIVFFGPGATDGAAGEISMNLTMLIGYFLFFLPIAFIFLSMGVKRLNNIDGQGKIGKYIVYPLCGFAAFIGLIVAGIGVVQSMGGLSLF